MLSAAIHRLRGDFQQNYSQLTADVEKIYEAAIPALQDPKWLETHVGLPADEQAILTFTALEARNAVLDHESFDGIQAQSAERQRDGKIMSWTRLRSCQSKLSRVSLLQRSDDNTLAMNALLELCSSLYPRSARHQIHTQGSTSEESEGEGGSMKEHTESIKSPTKERMFRWAKDTIRITPKSTRPASSASDSSSC